MTASPNGRPAPRPDPLDLPLKSALVRMANGISPASVALAHVDWLTHLAVLPSKQSALATSAWLKGLGWWNYVARSSWQPDTPHCIEAPPDDRRFSHAEWQLPPFNALAQAFLLTQQWWGEATTDVRGVSQHHEDVTAFTVRQWLDMLSPSNSPVLNPQVLRETARQGGVNFLHGCGNWWRDALAVAAGGPPRGVEAFRPGEAVALTPGKVVHRNALVELIQYAPTTAKVRKEPVLIVPSWIMKYYILDLTPDDSLVKYLVDQGHTVFIVSWRNPDAADRDIGLDDYLDAGVLDTVAAVQRLCPDTAIHAAGYCLGGTLLAMGAAVFGARKEHPLKTVTLIAGQVDFQEPGELGLFMDESQVAFLEDLMAESGVLDGRRMAGAFQLINSKDLVWSKLLHEYLMGAETPMNALRAWNADATRLPARMHGEYLRRLYMDNQLADGEYRFRGLPICLRSIRVPLFVLGTERDHVSPWPSVFKVLRLAHAPARFVLTAGGHNVGVVNPVSGPAANAKASYRWADHPLDEQPPADPQAWLAAAQPERGSWWACWNTWLHHHGSAYVPARKVPDVRFDGKVVPAPGTHVFQQ
ncbi:PHA/PHB synthase family protein [Ramlibacter alkalitolerans]|uniref:Alpha/beta fold hydrolase n=1 Tax=Ramlibacter alkalitolerans TaxID=2039631 RepID=A0ABS1JTL5_9BURK|nr:alpha/beta fold hydrolase [Ramlibacter alkalitolerans]MBL0427625.1 alpha/beta fold hydrolase [Ramlibacter alkalitolerans]